MSGPDGAWPWAATGRWPLKNWRQKAGLEPLHFSAPDTSLLLEQLPGVAGEEDAGLADVIDLTDKLDGGVLDWQVPPGEWQILRIGYTIGNRSYVSTCSEGWNGYAIDVLERGAFQRYWDAVVQPLIADAGPLAGRTLKYLHTDSWEVEPLNWTPAMRDEFRQRREYDLVPWLPVLVGRIIENRQASHQFLYDFRKTLGDLAIDNHYRPFRDLAHARGLQIHPESGGPHAVPIDAQRCLGFSDVPMSEFWAWSWRHRIGDDNRLFVKQPASAAHTYGRRIVAAEGFTTIGPHWQETLWDNLKPAFDKACCEGLNRLVWHEFVCSPPEYGMPGLQYFAGTHLNPNVTWWSRSKPFFDYINRCQFMLQRGLFVADVCYYYGDHVPNFAQHKRTDPAGALPGYDYDVITQEALLERVAVADGDLVLPDGMRYRVLVLRDSTGISLPVLEKVQQLVHSGARVIGTRPTHTVSRQDGAARLQQLADELWGAGRVIPRTAARDVLAEAGVKPDVQFQCEGDQLDLDYIHRRDGRDDIYFVANRDPRGGPVRCTFRVAGKRAELWDPVSGDRFAAAGVTTSDEQTTLPLSFAPCGAWFVVFRSPGATSLPVWDVSAWEPSLELAGPWSVSFDPRWGGPEQVPFAQLLSWSECEEPGVKYYSGTATYRTEFSWPAGDTGGPVVLNLGEVRELAEVRLNGRALGILWSPPFRVSVDQALRPGTNRLEVDVVNFWPNRIIGDDALAQSQRVTRTNIRKLTRETQLMPSGLLGPVRLERKVSH